MKSDAITPSRTVVLRDRLRLAPSESWEEITYDVALLIDQWFHADSFALADLQAWVEDAADDLIEQGRHCVTLAKLATHTAYVILALEPYGDCE